MGGLSIGNYKYQGLPLNCKQCESRDQGLPLFPRYAKGSFPRVVVAKVICAYPLQAANWA